MMERTSETGRPIVIAGPTGGGKSRLGLVLADAIGGEILNFDSVQIYRGFDIGSAKPDAGERARVPHHLIDILDADEDCDAAGFALRARAVLDDIAGRDRRAILVGGTFFYLRALLAGLPEMPGRDEAIRERIRRIAARPRGPERLHRWLSKIDPQSGRKIAPADRHRVERALEVWLVSGRPISTWERPAVESVEEIPTIKVGLMMERQRLVAALDGRVDAMYAAGLIDETRALLARYRPDARPFGAIGYKEAAAVVAGGEDGGGAAGGAGRGRRAAAGRPGGRLAAGRHKEWLGARGRAGEIVPALVGGRGGGGRRCH